MFILVVVTWWSHGISQTTIPGKYTSLAACEKAAAEYRVNADRKNIYGNGVCFTAPDAE